jgi:hypothetical protein
MNYRRVMRIPSPATTSRNISPSPDVATGYRKDVAVMGDSR